MKLDKKMFFVSKKDEEKAFDELKNFNKKSIKQKNSLFEAFSK